MSRFSVHRYVSRTWLPMVAIYGFTAWALTRVRADPTAWSWPQYAALAAAPVVVSALMIVLFRRTIRVDDDGIESAWLFGRARLAWNAVRAVKIKPGGYGGGRSSAHRIVLTGETGKVIVTSEFGGFAALAATVDAALQRVGGPSVAAAQKAYDRSWGAQHLVPDIAVMGETLALIVWFLAAVPLLITLLDTPLFRP